MNAMTCSLLRVLDRVERIKKDRERNAHKEAERRSALHTRYEAYKAAQSDDERELPWA